MKRDSRLQTPEKCSSSASSSSPFSAQFMSRMLASNPLLSVQDSAQGQLHDFQMPPACFDTQTSDAGSCANHVP
ncbi:hypothetical protein Vi05172_g13083 [Venturia inaequalis]|nr:hypothetical protein Vi05172_g13083 [Venturia inaequalis]